MRRDSIRRRLIAAVVFSQAILTAGLMITGVSVTYWRLLATLEAKPKPLAWKMRARVGTRVRWYQEVSTKEATYMARSE